MTRYLLIFLVLAATVGAHDLRAVAMPFTKSIFLDVRKPGRGGDGWYQNRLIHSVTLGPLEFSDIQWPLSHIVSVQEADRIQETTWDIEVKYPEYRDHEVPVPNELLMRWLNGYGN